MRKHRLVVDAGAIAEPNRSGVGHTALRIVEGLAMDSDFITDHEIILVVAFNKAKYIDERLRKFVSIKKVYLPGKVMNALVRYRLLPPMDLFFGKGVYLFPNFKNWPLLSSRSITYIHDVYFKVNPEHIEPRNLSFLRRHVDEFIKRTDVIVTVSNHAKAEIERYFPDARHKTTVVYNGIDHSEFYRRPADEQKKVGKKYNIAPGRYFIYLSNLEPRKNVEALLEAFRVYTDRSHGDDKLLLVGGMGWNNEKVISRISQLQSEGYNIIKPSKYVPDEDLPPLLSGAIALVHPAHYEGFGLSPLQAIACGTRVIIGDNSSIPEVVGAHYHDYVDISSLDSIADRMMQYKKGGKLDALIAKQAGMFTWSKSTQRLIEVIDNLEYNT